MNFIIFKINNVPHIVIEILFKNDKEIITCFYEVLTRHTNLNYCYGVNDMKKFNMIKQYLINSIINGKSFYKDIDLSSIKAF